MKYGVVLDADLFGFLETNRAEILARRDDVLQNVVARCCSLKARLVEQDERDLTGLRALLNYGHTFGHAIEKVTGYGELLHGEAVAIGMTCAAKLAQRLGLVDEQLGERQTALLTFFGLPTQVPPLPTDELFVAMGRDKKVQHGSLQFVLPLRLGAGKLVGDISTQDIEAALRP